jgi:hypothetical protein
MSARVTVRPYADPYLAGVGLGLVLLASFVLAGRGLGASGAFASAAATSVQAVAPAAIAGQSVSREHLGAGGPLRDWLVVEILGRDRRRIPLRRRSRAGSRCASSEGSTSRCPEGGNGARGRAADGGRRPCSRADAPAGRRSPAARC